MDADMGEGAGVHTVRFWVFGIFFMVNILKEQFLKKE